MARADEDALINEEIVAPQVRLVSPDGEQVGIKSLEEAQAIARELDLDLVEVAPGADPPVCRIMDYGKYKYEAAQRAKGSKRRSSNTTLKEMKYRPKIGRGDFDTKTSKVIGFLDGGHKVKVTIMFRGRELFHPELGREILERVAESVDGVGKVDQFPKLDGRNMTMVLSPEKQSGRKRRDATNSDAASSDASGTGNRDAGNRSNGNRATAAAKPEAAEQGAIDGSSGDNGAP